MNRILFVADLWGRSDQQGGERTLLDWRAPLTALPSSPRREFRVDSWLVGEHYHSE